ncbi:Hsp33 family molecular chaperone [Rhodobacteraceae bacterium RKSG542]|uniref:Hsp33 family molecular chaperone n=1 Tax=Pseudovibrio flavus TaxID=2529854 RepID=UPI0012BD20E4|nr:Hsp33 family molecular chaperone [Pseudovibrio flavus]MTI18768.1 Hsp33 family molecular chaperone [Pseudovibrio flavus]
MSEHKDEPAQIQPVGNDAVLPFSVEGLDVRGRAVFMGPVLTSMLARHDYPVAVKKLLAEATVLTAMLGSTLKFDGRLTLQAQSDGAVSMLVVDFNAPDGLRATASFNREKVEEIAAKPDFKPEDLLGRGHLAFTVEQGARISRYQGIVVLNGGTSLEDAAHDYFMKSEQIPTRVRLAVAEMLTRSEDGTPEHSWRAGGIMVQFLPKAPERMKQADIHPGDAPEGTEVHDVEEDDAWVEAKALVDTVKDSEITDPDLGVEQLLFRLFHERGARVYDPHPMADRCTCSAEKISKSLKNFPEEDQKEMLAEGTVSVNCDFCGAKYTFDPAEVFGDK